MAPERDSDEREDAPPTPRQATALLGVLALPVVVALLLYATWRPVDTSPDQYAIAGFVVGAALTGVVLSASPRVRRRWGRRQR